jgi:cob(I)alamin adenosyltransferase
MDIYTRKGDDGSTGLFYGGRVSKASGGPEAYGTVDESVAALGVARALVEGDVAEAILRRQRELFVVAAELATDPANRHKLADGTSRVTPAMVDDVEREIDAIVDEVGMPREFLVPGGNQAAAAIDVARTVVRRAERRAVSMADSGDLDGSEVVRYLNRLADYLYMLARAVEGQWTPSRQKEDE